MKVQEMTPSSDGSPQRRQGAPPRGNHKSITYLGPLWPDLAPPLRSEFGAIRHQLDQIPHWLARTRTVTNCPNASGQCYRL